MLLHCLSNQICEDLAGNQFTLVMSSLMSPHVRLVSKCLRAICTGDHILRVWITMYQKLVYVKVMFPFSGELAFATDKWIDL